MDNEAAGRLMHRYAFEIDAARKETKSRLLHTLENALKGAQEAQQHPVSAGTEKIKVAALSAQHLLKNSHWSTHTEILNALKELEDAFAEYGKEIAPKTSYSPEPVTLFDRDNWGYS
jgi:hypothetical protein